MSTPSSSAHSRSTSWTEPPPVLERAVAERRTSDSGIWRAAATAVRRAAVDTSVAATGSGSGLGSGAVDA
jgi:hypothetical protein